MFGKLRDTFVKNTISSDTYHPKTRIVVSQIGKGVIHILSGIAGIYYSVSGTENIPKDKNFILIANHPGALDFFPIKKTLHDLGIDINFLVHKNFLHHPLTSDLSQEHGLIGVQRFDERNKHKIPGAYKENVKGLRKGVQLLQEGKNIGLFISGEGYLKGMEKVFQGYRLLIKKGNTQTVLPVIIVGNKITFLPAIEIADFKDESFENIEASMRSFL